MRRRKWFLRGALLCLGTLGGLLLGELLIRTGGIRPNRQIIRGHNLHAIDGVPVWENEPERENFACVTQHPDWKRLVFFGNSVTYGAGVEGSESFTSVLQERLNATGPDHFCVLNLAQPGFHFDQELALASEVLPKLRPNVAIIQDGPMGPHQANTTPETLKTWPCRPWHYEVVGEDAFEVNGLVLRADGFPGLRGVPDGLNHALFSHSRLYQYMTLGIGEHLPEHVPPADTGFIKCRGREFETFVAQCKASGTVPLAFLATEMNFPLSDLTSREGLFQLPLLDYAREHRFAMVRMRSLLSDQDAASIKLDDWHYNIAGHKVLGERLAPIMRALVDGRDWSSLPMPDTTQPVRAAPEASAH